MVFGVVWIRNHGIATSRYSDIVELLTRCACSLQIPVRNLRTQARHEYLQPEEPEEEAFMRSLSLTTPRQLVHYLNQFVIGQERAKKILSVAVFNHYNRVRANLSAIEKQVDTQSWDESSSRGGRLPEISISSGLNSPQQ
ncbi:hypothetical protein M404DRAFT_709097 [Pisolithus tinctorius Marx 270]|uniref:Uncharacterized protein n=1 Tax=Pisolithus tinctorius Marx 270 TaxID=870435 RepID=A0A0C3JV73_PISTI|nr:hypothetical protein M404DRAFT_709097 [Pisolithus tinctorius Marx 270]